MKFLDELEWYTRALKAARDRDQDSERSNLLGAAVDRLAPVSYTDSAADAIARPPEVLHPGDPIEQLRWRAAIRGAGRGQARLKKLLVSGGSPC